MSPRLRVLVVDDDPWTQQVVSSQLTESGFRVDCAADGWEALILAGRACPDLALIEVHLPTTDGRQVILSRYTEPEKDHQLLLQRLKFQLPAQPKPKITTNDMKRSA